MKTGSTPGNCARVWRSIGAILVVSLVMAWRADAVVRNPLPPTALSQPDLALTQSIDTPHARSFFFIGETVTFEIVVANTGHTVLAQLPLMLHFDPTCLAYQVNSAQPIETSHDDIIGLVQWYDLTLSNVMDLAPEQQFTILVHFTVTGPCRDGYSTATVHGALDEFGQMGPDREATIAFTCLAQAAIGDYIWNDGNADGLQNEGRNRGINGMKVRLYLDDGNGSFEPGASDLLVDTQTTAGDGRYLFTQLAAGAYWVDVLDIGLTTAGYAFIGGPESGPKPQLITLDAETRYFGADFGYAGRASISGAAFYDWDQDGAQGVDEAGIEGVQICLYRDSNHNDQLDEPGDTQIACMNTDPDGLCVFPPHLPGRYLLVETQPAGLRDTTPNVLAIPLVVVGLAAPPTFGFGEILYGSLGGAVYIDFNENGVRDPSETIGLTNIPLRVTGTNVLGAAVDTVITATNGYYLSQDLLPGAYQVTAPESYNPFRLTSLSAHTATLTVAEIADLDLDFGYISPLGVSVQLFTAQPGPGRVTLDWLAFGEPAPRFHVWRAENGKGLDAVQLTAQPVSGAGGAYQFVDRAVARGQTYWYWLEDVADGQRTGPLAATVPLVSLQTYLPVIGR